MIINEQQAKKVSLKMGKTMSRELLKIGKPTTEDIFLVNACFTAVSIASLCNMDENEATNLTDMFSALLKKMVVGTIKKFKESKAQVEAETEEDDDNEE